MLETISSNLFHLLQLLLGFTYYYPLYMAYLWMFGAIFFYFRYEHKKTTLPKIKRQPRISIIVPCFNEEANAVEVISHLFSLNYRNYEIIAVNDGSTDNTREILERLANQNARLHVIHHAKNQGKAIALNTAARLATGDYIIGIDGDALLDADALLWFIDNFQADHKVGAVTGNPRIRTRSTLLGRLQVGEFSSLVGLIKRAQKTFYGHIFTASGVITAFRAEALKDVDYWSPEMLTEDMDITWKLQVKGWQVNFEPRALAWILMPETLVGLWKQRLRWAMGGLQIIGKFKSMFKYWRTYPMWPLMFEHVLSIVWACSVALLATSYLFEFLSVNFEILWQQIDTYVTGFSTATPSISTPSTIPSLAVPATDQIATVQTPVKLSESMTVFLPEFSGVIIGTTCLLQMLIAVMLDRHYGHQLLRYYLWVVWYPFGFWLINMLTIVVAIPKILFRGRDLRARWISPDRGIHENDHQPPSQSNRQTDPAAKNDHDDDRHSPQNAGVQTQYLSGENLILDHFCQQSLAYRWFTNCLTAMAWGFWLYLWLPIIDSFGHLFGWNNAQPTENFGALSRLLISLNEQLLTIIIFVAIFFLWSIIRRFNDHRFIDHENGIESRPRISKKTHDFDLSHNRLIIVSHEEETGRIKSIETRQPSAVLNTIQAGMH